MSAWLGSGAGGTYGYQTSPVAPAMPRSGVCRGSRAGPSYAPGGCRGRHAAGAAAGGAGAPAAAPPPAPARAGGGGGPSATRSSPALPAMS